MLPSSFSGEAAEVAKVELSSKARDFFERKRFFDPFFLDVFFGFDPVFKRVLDVFFVLTWFLHVIFLGGVFVLVFRRVVVAFW